MNYGLALLWSVDMGERNNPIDTMRAKARAWECSPLDAKIEVIENVPARAARRPGTCSAATAGAYNRKAR